MGAGALVLAGFLFAAVWTLTRSKGGPAPDRTAALDPRPVPRPRTAESAPKAAPPPDLSAPRAPKGPEPSPEETLATVVRLNRLIARQNMAGVVAALLTHTGRQREAEELGVLIWKGDLEVGEETARLPSNFDLQRIAAHHESGDRIIAFGPCSLDPNRPRPFIDALESWLRNFQVGTTQLATLRRGQETILVEMYFPEATLELAHLAARAGVALGGRAWK